MSEIIHTGIVNKKSDDSIEVQIIDGVECSSCSLKGACSIADSSDKMVKVQEGDTVFMQGERVQVEMSAQMAFSAMFWGYIFPFIVLLSSVVILSLFYSEGVAGLTALAFLSIYYLLVYLNKNYFDKKFRLKIKRL